MRKTATFAGRYKVLGYLARGATCCVVKARHLLFDRLVALKFPWPSLATDEEVRRRFLREATNCARLDHPNIVTIYDVSEYQGVPYLSMQYVDGGSLADLFAKGLALKPGVTCLAQVAEALAAAHALDLVHRDLKPTNVLLTREGEVKVADWGLSKMLGRVDDLSRPGIVMGTPLYMAPEQITGKPLTPGTDLYALGAMLYELLAGEPPFTGTDVGSIFRNHVGTAPPALEPRAPGAPSALVALATALLAKSPTARPRSAALVARQLQASLLGLSSVPSGAARAGSRTPGRKPGLSTTKRPSVARPGARARY